jgi:hypothetical protein
MAILNDTHKLIDPAGGTEVKPGDPVTDFRGDPDVFRYVSKAPGGNSQGKIITDRGGELYPSVFGLTIVPRSETSDRSENIYRRSS